MGQSSSQTGIRGRGAVSNRSGRFEPHSREKCADGWWRDTEEVPRPATVVQGDHSRSVISRNTSPDVPFERSINPYRGCEHGCIYCFARPTHAYLGLSPGLDFETRLFAKHDAARLLRAELARPGYRPRTLALGAVTDPYQPVERRLQITRQVLGVLAETRHPVSIVTKSALVLRDLDILAPMAAEGLAQVCISLATLDRALARRMEPRAPTPRRRLRAIRELARAGVPTVVLTAPMIPGLNDTELEALLEAAAGEGASGASYVLLRLPLELGPLFEEWLDSNYPDRKSRVLALVRETHGGVLYNAAWGDRMKGRGAYAELLRQRFEVACRRFGLDRGRWLLDCGSFRPPARDSRQLSLL